MKRLLLIPTLAAFALHAQDAPKPQAGEPAAQEAKTEAAKTTEAAKPAEAPPVPALPDTTTGTLIEPQRPSILNSGVRAPGEGPLLGNENLSGSIEVGYRWNGELHGNLDAYRSVVNLGEGVRLLNFDLNYLAPQKGGWLERLNARASGWGGDPYSQLHLEALADRKYRLTVDQRSMAYFNALPSFANPKVDQGILFTQDSFDIKHQLTDIELELIPGSRISPYFGYQRNGDTGRGVMNFVQNLNEYPVGTQYDSKTDLYRGGVRINLSRIHLTLEGGGTNFRDDQGLFTNDMNPGNRTTTFQGQTLFLSSAQQSYGVTGDSLFFRGLFTARPADWVDVYANFLFAQPETNSAFQYTAAGNFANTNPILFYTQQQLALGTAAKQPHTNANGGFELRPFRRFRIVESFTTDRLHTAGAVNTVTGTPTPQQSPGIDRLNLNYNENRVEVLFDITNRLTLRGGEKSIWGDSYVRAPSLASDFRLYERGELRINAGLAGVTYRVSNKFSLYGDAEIGRGSRSYFQTSLQNYERVRVRASYQATGSVNLSGSYSYFKNLNPGGEQTFSFDSRNASLALQWAPRNSKYIHFLGEYSRNTFTSDAQYVVPQDFSRARSYYTDRGNSATALVDISFWGSRRAPRLSFGGSLWRSSGTRASHFYQPLARFTAPVFPHVDLNAEWRWYSLTEPSYLYESFRQHQAIFSIRLY